MPLTLWVRAFFKIIPFGDDNFADFYNISLLEVLKELIAIYDKTLVGSGTIIVKL